MKPAAGAAASVTGVEEATEEVFPKRLRASTIIACTAQAPAVRARAGVVNTSLLGGPACTVSFWVAAVHPAAEAVTCTVPAAVPVKWNDAELLPIGSEREVTAVVQPASAKEVKPAAGAETSPMEVAAVAERSSGFSLALKRSVSWVYHRAEDGTQPVKRLAGWGVRFIPAELRAWIEASGDARRR